MSTKQRVLDAGTGPGRELAVSQYAGKVPLLRRDLFLRAAKGEASPRQAIKAMCQQCVCYENMPEAIRDCPSTRCPLWAYRPYQENT